MKSFVVSTADVISGFQFVTGEGVGRISEADSERLRKAFELHQKGSIGRNRIRVLEDSLTVIGPDASGYEKLYLDSVKIIKDLTAGRREDVDHYRGLLASVADHRDRIARHPFRYGFRKFFGLED